MADKNTSRMQNYTEDSIILQEGELRDEMYKIVSGKVAVYLNYGEENEYLLGILGEQQCFGELGILCKQPSLYTVVAVYDVLIMRIGIDEFDDFLQNNSKNTIDMLRMLAWSMMNLKCNLDLVLEELANSSKTEVLTVDKLMEKMRAYTTSNLHKTGIFDQSI